MNIELEWRGEKWQADLSKALSIAIPIKDGKQNPNCYFADPVKIKPITASDGFIGDMSRGGPVNHKKITLSPHGNGTHTECYGHITNSHAVVANQVNDHFHIAQLISVKPVKSNIDSVINEISMAGISLEPGISSLVVRTLPNDDGKPGRNYSGTNPAYFSDKVMEKFAKHGVNHLITDLPSVDKEQDGGKLAAHKAFWFMGENIRKNASITELAYIANTIPDGIYLLNLQLLKIHLDASPSNPVLFGLIQL